MLTYAEYSSGALRDAAVHKMLKLTSKISTTNMYAFSPAGMPTYADVCCRMLTYADVCGRMLKKNMYAISAEAASLDTLIRARRMLTYAHVCSRMLTYADVC